MSERRQAAWDEAQRRYPPGDRQAGFVSGAAWADDNPPAVAALRAVTDLHQPRNKVTQSTSGHLVDTPGPCTACDWDWPCPTTTAITAALGEECAAMRAELAEGKAAN